MVNISHSPLNHFSIKRWEFTNDLQVLVIREEIRKDILWISRCSNFSVCSIKARIKLAIQSLKMLPWRNNCIFQWELQSTKNSQKEHRKWEYSNGFLDLLKFTLITFDLSYQKSNRWLFSKIKGSSDFEHSQKFSRRENLLASQHFPWGFTSNISS